MKKAALVSVQSLLERRESHPELHTKKIACSYLVNVSIHYIVKPYRMHWLFVKLHVKYLHRPLHTKSILPTANQMWDQDTVCSWNFFMHLIQPFYLWKHIVTSGFHAFSLYHSKPTLSYIKSKKKVFYLKLECFKFIFQCTPSLLPYTCIYCCNHCILCWHLLSSVWFFYAFQSGSGINTSPQRYCCIKLCLCFFLLFAVCLCTRKPNKHTIVHSLPFRLAPFTQQSAVFSVLVQYSGVILFTLHLWSQSRVHLHVL